MLMIFRFSLLLVCLLFSSLNFAQKEKENKNINSKMIDSLLDSVHYYYTIVDLEKSYALANKTLALSKQIRYYNGMAESYMYLAQNYSGQGEYKKSQEYLGEVEKLSPKLSNNYLIFNYHRLKGRNFGELNLHQKSVSEFRNSLNLIEKIDKTQEEKDYLRCISFENLYVIYDMIGNKDSAYYYINLNRFLIDKIDPKLSYMSKSTLHTFLGKYFSELGKDDSAIYYFKSAQKIAKEFDFPYTSFNDENWGDYFQKKGDKKGALEKYLSAAKNNEDLKNFASLPPLYNKISDIYSELRDYENSTIFKNKTLALGVKIYDNKFETVGTELQELEMQKQKGLSILRIVQYALFGVLILLGIFILYYFVKIRPALKKHKLQPMDMPLLEIVEDKLEIDKEKLDEVKNQSTKDFNSLVQLAKENNPEFFAKFQDVYPDFIQKLLEIQPNLQTSELTFCAYLYLNFSTKDIANFTSTSPRTVQTRKYNIRKKFQIPTEEDLYIWIRKVNS
jgi:tetratricopeptide (TPR) repeat protein